MTTTGLTIKQFKDEFRLVCTDTWGNAMDAWFECTGHMYNRSLSIPRAWEYKPGLGDGLEPDSYFHDLFKECTDRQLIDIGNLLFRYCEYLRFKGINY